MHPATSLERFGLWEAAGVEVDTPFAGDSIKVNCGIRSEEYARLIAAAPDLLEALEDCLADLQHYVSTHGPGPDSRLAKAEAAIAKAKGV
jgi:hypothetical protein